MVQMRAKMIMVGLLGTATLLPFTSAKAQQVGHASWYALHSRTASGEMMNPSELTAAHRSLPFGTRVVVENLSTGQSVVVRINDRGPFVGGRIIDLSKAAAANIGMIGSGTARVRISTAGGDALQALGASRPKITKTAAVPEPEKSAMMNATLKGTASKKAVKTASAGMNPVPEPEKSAMMSATLKGTASKKSAASTKSASSKKGASSKRSISAKKSASSKRSISAKKSANIRSVSRKSAGTRSASTHKSAKSVRTASLSKKKYGTSRSSREKIVLASKSASSLTKQRSFQARAVSKTGRVASKRSGRKTVTVASRRNLHRVPGGRLALMKGKSRHTG
jgi:rare lipoprotein A